MTIANELWGYRRYGEQVKYAAHHGQSEYDISGSPGPVCLLTNSIYHGNIRGTLPPFHQNCVQFSLTTCLKQTLLYKLKLLLLVMIVIYKKRKNEKEDGDWYTVLVLASLSSAYIHGEIYTTDFYRQKPERLDRRKSSVNQENPWWIVYPPSTPSWKSNF